MSFFSSVLLVGCGNMGGALLASWRGHGVKAEDIKVIEPTLAHAERITRTHGVECYESLDVMPENYRPECVVLAVKPHTMEVVLPHFAKRFGVRPLYMSVAAGKTIAFFQKFLGHDAAIIRTMPNVLSQIGRGVTGAAAGEFVSPTQREQAQTLLGCQGEVVWVEEDDIDKVTSIAGSGPAYIFYLVEAMVKAGEHVGLQPEMAKMLALHTIRGAADLAMQSPEPVDKLRVSVTSPGGTTEAALRVLMSPDNGFEPLLREAMEAAVKRAKEIAE